MILYLMFLLAATSSFHVVVTAKVQNLKGSAKCGRSGGREEVDLMIVGGTILTMAEDSEKFVVNGAVAVKNSIIVYVGDRDDVESGYCASEVVEAGEHDIVMPGIINGHTHAPMTLLRSIAGDQLPLGEWLNDFIFPAEAAAVNPEFCMIGCQLAMLEMLRTGTTTFVDFYYFEDDIAQVVSEAGMRAILGQTVINFPAPDAATPDDALERANNFLEKWQGHPLVTAAVAPHAPNTLDKEYLEAAADLARQYEAPITIHLAETQAEVDFIQEIHGSTPVAYLNDIGFLGPDVIAAHSIYFDDDDLRIILDTGTGVVHSPESNMKLGSGVMRLPNLIEIDAKVGLSTDGPASNDNLNMFEAMLVTPLLQKVTRKDTTVISAPDVLTMSTIGGARAIGLDSKIGSIEVGKEADIIVLDGSKPNMVPAYNIESLLVYGANGADVRATIVAGKVLFLDGKYLTIDYDEVIAAARVQSEIVRDIVGI